MTDWVKVLLDEMILDSALLSVLSSLFLLLSQAEVQWSCSQHERCQMLCSCKCHPPPPPPPPPPPRMLLTVDPGISVPLLRSWWMDVIVLGTVGSALAFFLLFSIIICYKAIKSSTADPLWAVDPELKTPVINRSSSDMYLKLVRLLIKTFTHFSMPS
ncbi:proline-rich membrane anchor 1-like [Triplophysa rosa]|uniref:proline-rich membrane anchor 1-like n=1 Tax=Triplophysa rosa TaxID=992332 RepID=UPI002545FACD|nr:proline-rich membrane anchor 1-like [Triplophysa rosa]